MLPTTKVVHIRVEEPSTGRTLSGDFTLKRLNLAAAAAVGVEQARRNGGMKAEDLGAQAAVLNLMFATFKHAIVKAPEWWKPEEFYDVEPLKAVWEAVDAFEASFRASVDGPDGSPPGSP